jgi:uncharacterized protein YktB (UPF0637 family)
MFLKKKFLKPKITKLKKKSKVKLFIKKIKNKDQLNIKNNQKFLKNQKFCLKLFKIIYK